MTETTIAAMTSTGKDDWETPHWLFDKLNAEFQFTLDPCCGAATRANRHGAFSFLHLWQSRDPFSQGPRVIS